MNKKAFETNFKRKLKKYAQNMCVMCTKNETCSLPLHGKFSAKGEPCIHAELVSYIDIMLWGLKNLYGLSDAQCAQFFRRIWEHGCL